MVYTVFRLLVIVLIFAGCAKETQYINKCPSMQVLDDVERITITVKDGAVRGADLQNMANLLQILRLNDEFYKQQANSYNERIKKNNEL